MSFLIAFRVATATNKEHLTVNCDNQLTHTEHYRSRLIFQISWMKQSAG